MNDYTRDEVYNLLSNVLKCRNVYGNPFSFLTRCYYLP